MEKDIVTNEDFYLIGDVKIEVYYEEEMDGFAIAAVMDKSKIHKISELFIPNTINGKIVGDFYGDITDWLRGFDKVIVYDDNPTLKVIDGVLFSRDEETLLMYPPEKKDERYVVPMNVKNIHEDAFCANRYLKTLVLATGVKEIDAYALAGCTNLETIYIPKSLKYIGFKAFHFCSALREVFYEGTEIEWDQIDFTDFNENVSEANVHFNSNTQI